MIAENAYNIVMSFVSVLLIMLFNPLSDYNSNQTSNIYSIVVSNEKRDLFVTDLSEDKRRNENEIIFRFV